MLVTSAKDHQIQRTSASQIISQSQDHDYRVPISSADTAELPRSHQENGSSLFSACLYSRICSRTGGAMYAPFTFPSEWPIQYSINESLNRGSFTLVVFSWLLKNFRRTWPLTFQSSPALPDMRFRKSLMFLGVHGKTRLSTVSFLVEVSSQRFRTHRSKEGVEEPQLLPFAS